MHSLEATVRVLTTPGVSSDSPEAHTVHASSCVHAFKMWSWAVGCLCGAGVILAHHDRGGDSASVRAAFEQRFTCEPLEPVRQSKGLE